MYDFLPPRQSRFVRFVKKVPLLPPTPYPPLNTPLVLALEALSPAPPLLL